MTRYVVSILVLLTAAASVTWAAPQNGSGKSVEVARQKLLARRLKNAMEGAELTASIQHNRHEWEQLTPDQQDLYRQEAMAFANKSEPEQNKLLDHYDKLIKMSAQTRKQVVQRAQWLSVVVASFSDQQRKELAELSPQERARKLLERKAELIQQGKLPSDSPATQPAGKSPATKPAN